MTLDQEHDLCVGGCMEGREAKHQGDYFRALERRPLTAFLEEREYSVFDLPKTQDYHRERIKDKNGVTHSLWVQGNTNLVERLILMATESKNAISDETLDVVMNVLSWARRLHDAGPFPQDKLKSAMEEIYKKQIERKYAHG